MFKGWRDRDAIGRLREEEYYERAMSELAQGSRRDGLWLKAMTICEGDEAKAKIKYVELLIQSYRDADYILLRHSEAKAQQAKFEQPYQAELVDQSKDVLNSPPEVGPIKRLVLWLILCAASAVIIFLFFPVVFGGNASVGDYAAIAFLGLIIYSCINVLDPT